MGLQNTKRVSIRVQLKDSDEYINFGPFEIRDTLTKDSIADRSLIGTILKEVSVNGRCQVSLNPNTVPTTSEGLKVVTPDNIREKSFYVKKRKGSRLKI